jgi:UDP-N-acetylglucosamine transferase subunit ALG13
MIFVTVGTHYQEFERLVKKMDEIAAKIDEKVIMQIGYTNYEPKNARWFKFLSYDEINTFYRKSNLIISHAGAGTLLDILNLKKPSIIVPRLKKYGEHIDDQQIELGEALERSKKVIMLRDIENLEETINKLNLGKIEALKTDKNLVNFLKNYLGSPT